jgi:hypothetical protein
MISPVLSVAVVLIRTTPQPTHYVPLPSKQKAAKAYPTNFAILPSVGESDDCIGLSFDCVETPLCNLSAGASKIELLEAALLSTFFLH